MNALIEKKLHEMEREKRQNAWEIQIMDEWIRLSIVDKTALMVAYKQSFHGAKGDLDGALILFREIKQNQKWHETNIEKNLRPYDEHLRKEMLKL